MIIGATYQAIGPNPAARPAGAKSSATGWWPATRVTVTGEREDAWLVRGGVAGVILKGCEYLWERVT